MEQRAISRDTDSTDNNKHLPGNRSNVRALRRLVLYFGITLIHVAGAAVNNLLNGYTGAGSVGRDRRILHRWAIELNRSLGLAVTVRGIPPEDGVLLVSNHRSYMDITAIGELAPATFLAKQEVALWPVLGYGCRLVDVVFVDRDNTDSRRRSREEVARRLWQHTSIVVFPEGTSHEGPGLLSFKPGIFQIAAQNRFPIVPVAVEYEDPRDAWVGDDTFIRHFLQTFSKRKVPVTVTFGPVMKGDDPVRLMKSSWKWIYSSLVTDGKRDRAS